MARKANAVPELIEAAEKVARETADAYELRQAQAILLPALFSLDLIATGRAIGRSRASVSRLQAAFRAVTSGRESPRRNWGGRRRQNLTFEKEQAFLVPFLATAQGGGVLVVSDIHRAYEAALGKRVPPSTIYRLLARHGWRKIAPARRHPKSDPAAQQAWKKNSRRT
jgi:transposase